MLKKKLKNIILKFVSILLEYDDVLNQQRMVIYKYRRRVLEGEEHIDALLKDMIAGSVEDLISFVAPARSINAEQVTQLYKELHIMTGLPEASFVDAKFNTSNVDLLENDIIEFLLKAHEHFLAQKDSQALKNAQKWLLLETIDQAWKQHMLNLDHLKEGIGLRQMGQKNPLVEYKREAFAMFQEMLMNVRRMAVQHVFHLNAEHFDTHALERKREKELDQMRITSAPTPPEEHDEFQAKSDKVGRNEPCSCGSGKKYKKCHGAGL